MAVTSMANSSIRDFQKFNSMNMFRNLGFPVQYVVVAGGGGVNASTGATGGAGAGGYRCNVAGENSGGGDSAEAPLIILLGTYPLTVGAGGPGAANGVNSVFSGIVSDGGGRTASNSTGFAGGSGGGGSNSSIPGSFSGGVGTSGQGFAGGAGNNVPGVGSSSGGGGGAAAVGTNGTAGASAGSGGNGVSSSITGSSVPRAGGGAGGDNGSAGTGGGGAVNTNGTVNTGGGAGGRSSAGTTNGGSGIVIFSISSSATVSFSVGVTETNATVGGNTVYSVTAAGPSDTVTIS